jgi:hypothetical protein
VVRGTATRIFDIRTRLDVKNFVKPSDWANPVMVRGYCSTTDRLLKLTVARPYPKVHKNLGACSEPPDETVAIL